MNDSAEKVEVKRIKNQPEKTSAPMDFHKRLYNAIFPIIGGLILDFADFVTLGPIGLYTGMIVGCTVGWLIGGIYNFSRNGRIICSILAGIYCTIPGTFFLPLATAISVISRFNQKPKSQQN